MATDASVLNSQHRCGLEIPRDGICRCFSKFAVERSTTELLLQLFVERVCKPCDLLERSYGMIFDLSKSEEVHCSEDRVAR